MRAIAYCRVSTEEQGESKAGLEAQEATIRAEVERRNWELVDIRTDVASGKSLRKRDELGRTLRDLAVGEADVLVVAKLDRLSRSVSDFAAMMETAKTEGWSIRVLDLDVDMTTSMGELVANIMISLAQWERRVIGERTKVALAAVKARGDRLGRKPNVDNETKRLIRVLRESGLSWGRVAERLTEEGVPTAQGGKWYAATVRKIHMQEMPPPMKVGA
jgi:DNA invertase Pin-like site-specific DNA recombinase